MRSFWEVFSYCFLKYVVRDELINEPKVFDIVATIERFSLFQCKTYERSFTSSEQSNHNWAFSNARNLFRINSWKKQTSIIVRCIFTRTNATADKNRLSTFDWLKISVSKAQKNSSSSFEFIWIRSDCSILAFSLRCTSRNLFSIALCQQSASKINYNCFQITEHSTGNWGNERRSFWQITRKTSELVSRSGSFSFGDEDKPQHEQVGA